MADAPDLGCVSHLARSGSIGIIAAILKDFRFNPSTLMPVPTNAADSSAKAAPKLIT